MSGPRRRPSAVRRALRAPSLVAITLWAVPLAGLISCASLLLTAVRAPSPSRGGAGFSGVIFALAACEAARGGGRRAFGVVGCRRGSTPGRCWSRRSLFRRRSWGTWGACGGVSGDGLARGGAASATPPPPSARGVPSSGAAVVGGAAGSDGVGRGRHPLRRGTSSAVVKLGLGRAASAARQRAARCLRGRQSSSPPPAPAGASVGAARRVYVSRHRRKRRWRRACRARWRGGLPRLNGDGRAAWFALYAKPHSAST